jgi:hypothetical protein
MAIQVEDRIGLAQLGLSNHTDLTGLGEPFEDVARVYARARRAFQVQA